MITVEDGTILGDALDVIDLTLFTRERIKKLLTFIPKKLVKLLGYKNTEDMFETKFKYSSLLNLDYLVCSNDINSIPYNILEKIITYKFIKEVIRAYEANHFFGKMIIKLLYNFFDDLIYEAEEWIARYVDGLPPIRKHEGYIYLINAQLTDPNLAPYVNSGALAYKNIFTSEII